MGMIDDLKEGSSTEMKRKLKTDTNEGNGCQGPAVRQGTNDDDLIMTSLYRYISIGLPARMRSLPANNLTQCNAHSLLLN